ncbi:MAG TPA: hypothetical protein VFC26_14995 [Verrucomicrobiae bacterium]|nr:hypothetical protein [Verrucomicrobiae bacterium]
MKPSLQKLITAARKVRRLASAAPESEAPFGFATRVAARWAAQRRASAADVWQRLCWWGATASIAICLFSAVYRATLPEPNAFDLLLEQPVMEADDL